MTKNIMFCLLFLTSTFGFSQSKPKITEAVAYTIELSVDSAEEIEKALSQKDIDYFFSHTDSDEIITFKLHCRFSEAKDNIKGEMTYTVSGNSSKKEEFMKGLEKAKATAIKFYNLKNKI